MKIYTLGDQKGYVELVDVMGNDLSIVNDARVSYDKQSSELTEGDIKLIKYLIKHNHTSPLRGCALKFEVKCPLYIARQWWKHHIASSYSEGQDGWNEVSFRYTKLKTDDFYVPEKLYVQDKDNKQGSNKEQWLSEAIADRLLGQYKINATRSIETYNKMIEHGISREIARGVLPACVYTSFRWTVSLHAFLHFLSLRKGKGAQSEITKYADALQVLAESHFPHTITIFGEINNGK